MPNLPKIKSLIQKAQHQGVLIRSDKPAQGTSCAVQPCFAYCITPDVLPDQYFLLIL